MRSAETPELRFSAWLAAHGAIPRQLSRAYAPEPADEDDLHQEMLVQLWRSIGRFRGQAKPSTWIYRVCLNTALTWRRTERRREARVVTHPASVEAATCAAATPAAAQEHHDLRTTLLRAVRALPSPARTLIVLALDGLNYREISDVTGMTENHVGVALTRARKQLAERLQEVTDEL